MKTKSGAVREREVQAKIREAFPPPPEPDPEADLARGYVGLGTIGVRSPREDWSYAPRGAVFAIETVRMIRVWWAEVEARARKVADSIGWPFVALMAPRFRDVEVTEHPLIAARRGFSAAFGSIFGRTR